MNTISGIISTSNNFVLKKYTNIFDHKNKSDFYLKIDAKKTIYLRQKNLKKKFINNSKYIIVFSGEIKNRIELNILFFKNIDLDCSIEDFLLEGFKKFGINFIKNIDGDFTLIIFDKINKTFYFFTDLNCKSNLYYYFEKNVLLFSNSFKDLIKLNNKKFFLQKICTQSLIQFLNIGFINSPNTIFKSIKKNESGKFIIFKDNVKINRFFSFEIQNNTDVLEYDFIENLENILINSVESNIENLNEVFSLFLGGKSFFIINHILDKLKKKVNLFTVNSQLFNNDKNNLNEFANKKIIHKKIEFNIHNSNVSEKLLEISKNIDYISDGIALVFFDEILSTVKNYTDKIIYDQTLDYLLDGFEPIFLDPIYLDYLSTIFKENLNTTSEKNFNKNNVFHKNNFMNTNFCNSMEFKKIKMFQFESLEIANKEFLFDDYLMNFENLLLSLLSKKNRINIIKPFNNLSVFKMIETLPFRDIQNKKKSFLDFYLEIKNKKISSTQFFINPNQSFGNFSNYKKESLLKKIEKLYIDDVSKKILLNFSQTKRGVINSYLFINWYKNLLNV